MDCPNCGAPTEAFSVPADLREYAPDAASALAICTRCLELTDAERPDEGDLSRISEDFPDDDGGAAMALAVGLLVDSVVHHKTAVAALFDRVQDDGEDPWLVLERLGRSGSVEPDDDLDRLRRQLSQLSG